MFWPFKRAQCPVPAPSLRGATDRDVFVEAKRRLASLRLCVLPDRYHTVDAATKHLQESWDAAERARRGTYIATEDTL